VSKALGEKACGIMSNRQIGKIGMAINCMNGYYIWTWVEEWAKQLNREITYEEAEEYANKLYDEHFYLSE